MTQEDRRPGDPVNVGKYKELLLWEGRMRERNKAMEKKLQAETYKLVVKGLGIAFVVFVVLVLVARLFGWIEW